MRMWSRLREAERRIEALEEDIERLRKETQKKIEQIEKHNREQKEEKAKHPDFVMGGHAGYFAGFRKVKLLNETEHGWYVLNELTRADPFFVYNTELYALREDAK